MLNSSASLAMSTRVLKALSGELDIKRHSPSILYFMKNVHCLFFVHLVYAALHINLGNDKNNLFCCSFTNYGYLEDLLYDWREPCLLIGPVCLPENMSNLAYRVI